MTWKCKVSLKHYIENYAGNEVLATVLFKPWTFEKMVFILHTN